MESSSSIWSSSTTSSVEGMGASSCVWMERGALRSSGSFHYHVRTGASTPTHTEQKINIIINFILKV